MTKHEQRIEVRRCCVECYHEGEWQNVNGFRVCVGCIDGVLRQYGISRMDDPSVKHIVLNLPVPIPALFHKEGYNE